MTANSAQTDQGKPAADAPELRHPLLLGSAVSVVLGVVTLMIEAQDLNSFQSPLAATAALVLIFGYFPLALFVSPGLAAVFTTLRYHNTKGIRRYFGGAAAFGVVFVLLIAYVFFIMYATSGA